MSKVLFTTEMFKNVNDELQFHFDVMSHQHLYFTDCDVDEMWHLYLDSLNDSIYRKKQFHDCSACRSWFKKMAGVISIDDNGTVTTMWSGNTLNEYKETFNKLHNYVMNNFHIKSPFLVSHDEIGIESSIIEEDGYFTKHYHFFTQVPSKYVKQSKIVNKELANLQTNRATLENSIDLISLDAINTVLELIGDNNLYRGNIWEADLKRFKEIKTLALDLSEKSDNVMDIFFWNNSLNVGDRISKIKNSSIGVLLIDLTNAMDIDLALKRYEDIVAPSNYQRPKEIFTTDMVDQAQEKIKELGYIDSLQRRYAIIDDLSINDVLYVDKGISNLFKDLSGFFDKLRSGAIIEQKRTEGVPTISLSDFIENIIPEADDISIYAASNLTGNFVSLIAPENIDAPSMFQWSNAFCWSYKNNLADSMKERVKAMGGDVDVDLRFSIQWNHLDSWNMCDYDAHCIEPDIPVPIYYHNKQSRYSDGYLDVDVVSPRKNIPAVENIRFKNKKRMREGTYLFRVHCFNICGNNDGFDAEIEFDNKIFKFSYHKPLKYNEFIDVAYVKYYNGNFEIIPILTPIYGSNKVWNINMNTFVPVSLICYSPNYWGNNSVGNKHVFFMIKNCINRDTPNAWYNEYLKPELKNENKRVMEALGRIAKVKESDNQLSGLGFSTTKKETFLVKVTKDNIEQQFNVLVGGKINE